MIQLAFEISHLQTDNLHHKFICQSDYPIDFMNLGIIINQLEYE